MTDLWPDDLGNITVRAPVTILKEQATFLGKKTRNILEAEVTPVDTVNSKGHFYYFFYLVAPALKSYRYRLFSILHTVELYPVAFSLEGDLKRELELLYNESPSSKGKVMLAENNKNKNPDNSLHIRAENEDQFVEILRDILNAKKTRQIIDSILAQSEGFRPNKPYIR